MTRSVPLACLALALVTGSAGAASKEELCRLYGEVAGVAASQRDNGYPIETMLQAARQAVPKDDELLEDLDQIVRRVYRQTGTAPGTLAQTTYHRCMTDPKM